MRCEEETGKVNEEDFVVDLGSIKIWALMRYYQSAQVNAEEFKRRLIRAILATHRVSDDVVHSTVYDDIVIYVHGFCKQLGPVYVCMKWGNGYVGYCESVWNKWFDWRDLIPRCFWFRFDMAIVSGDIDRLRKRLYKATYASSVYADKDVRDHVVNVIKPILKEHLSRNFIYVEKPAPRYTLKEVEVEDKLCGKIKVNITFDHAELVGLRIRNTSGFAVCEEDGSNDVQFNIVSVEPA